MPTAAKKATARGANPTDAVSHLADVTDRMHGLLMERADALMGCLEGSAEEAELAAPTDIIEAYESQRLAAWPNSRRQGLTRRVQFVLAEQEAGRGGSVLPRLAQLTGRDGSS
jgi:hypothetical protein